MPWLSGDDILMADPKPTPDYPEAPPSSNGHAPVERRLNLGAGESPMTGDGWENWDRLTGQDIYPLAGVPDDSVDELRCSHALEHFSHLQVADVLREWVRVLKPGGVLKVAVPNLEWIARSYLDGEPVNVQGYLYGGHVDENDYHKCGFDGEELDRALRAAGLYDVRPWVSELRDCAALPVSLNLRGRKPKPLPKLKVHAAFSVPRLGFQDNFFCWADALLPLGIKPAKYDGAFWGQCLERVMADLLDADYVLAVDYDSVFTRQQVEHLVRLAADYPTADAIAPVEIGRTRESILATVLGPDGKPSGEIAWDALKAELLPVASAHFGLTLLRTDALKRLPHPWFLGVPNKDGEWGEGRLDDDSYFWKKWREHGNTAFLASHVVIGHGQFMLTWPDRHLRPVYQHPAEFWKSGPPEGTWR